jgi:hypothetical protein
LCLHSSERFGVTRTTTKDPLRGWKGLIVFIGNSLARTPSSASKIVFVVADGRGARGRGAPQGLDSDGEPWEDGCLNERRQK